MGSGTLRARPSDGATAPGARTAGRRLAVLVLAYAARPSVERAVASVGEGRDGPDAPEILVLSTREAPPGWSDRHGSARWLRLPDEPLGAWIARVPEWTDAPLVAFLDDDDEFLPGKIARVLDLFRRYPAVAYLHHATLTASSEGPSPTELASRGPALPPADDPVIVDDAGKGPAALRELWARGASFNHSSVVVRRELLIGLGPVLRRLRGGVTPLLFYGALASPSSLAEDPRPLAIYRQHPGGESPRGATRPREYLARSIALASVRREDADTVLDSVARARPGLSTDPLRAARDRYALLEQLGPSGGRRRDLARAWAKAARTLPAIDPILFAAATLLALARALHPRLGRLRFVRPDPGQ